MRQRATAECGAPSEARSIAADPWRIPNHDLLTSTGPHVRNDWPTKAGRGEDRACRDTQSSAPLSWASAAAFHRHFWQPPGAHGDVVEGREVSFLELCYDDVVYVVIVGPGRRPPRGGRDVGSRGPVRHRVRLIWLAWINGAVYHDLHGRSRWPDLFLPLPADVRPRAPRGVHRQGDRGQRPGLRRRVLYVPGPSVGSGTRCSARTTRRCRWVALRRLSLGMLLHDLQCGR